MQNTDATEQRSLAQIVTSWSPSELQAIARDYSNSCKTVQIAFPGYDNYKNYFEPLLFAEVAAELVTATDKFARSPNKRSPKIRSRREEPGTLLVKVAVKKLSNKVPFGCAVEVDPTDNKGPVGCGEGDIVALWHVDKKSPPSNQKHIPPTAVLAVGNRPAGKHGVRLILTKFPDRDPTFFRQDMADPDQDKPRFWNLLRLGSITTIRREHQAVLNIKASPLLPVLLRPASKDSESSSAGQPSVSASVSAASAPAAPPAAAPPPSQHVFTGVVSAKMVLNASQTRAVAHASMSTGGFTVIQGPPGTGKTRTLIALLNVIHMTQYQEYYEALLASLEPIKRGDHTQSSSETASASKTAAPDATQGSLLQTMLAAMNKTVEAAIQGVEKQPLGRLRRPRLLICAPSNSAVDEVLTRLIKLKFFDGQGRTYCPELARIGAGDKVSDSAKPFTAEGQAERFLDNLCSPDMSAEAQREAQMSFLRNWQTQCNSLLQQLQRTPKTPDTRPKVIELHEQLERMDRNLRRLKIAADDGKKVLTRDEKLRQIARTYVEDAQLVFSTLSGAASSILTSRDQQETALFDTVVIDEAAQSTEPSCLVPLVLGAKRCLLVGDPQQLPATVLASGFAGISYGQSLLDRVCRAGKKVLLLDTQYRMHPAISSFPRRYFYEGNLVDDETVQGDNRVKPYHHDKLKPRLGPYVFLDVADGEEHRSRNDKSVFNPTEAELATEIYKKLKRDYASDCIFSPEGKAPGSTSGFGVVTPYKSQMHALRQAFDRAGVPTGDVEIDTVDSYQGREKEVVIFSCVRTAVNTGIGFVRDIRRMNVGLTRARSSLVVLGSAQALSEGSKDWAALVEDARSRGCLISVPDVRRAFALPSEPKPVPYQNDHPANNSVHLGITPIEYGQQNVGPHGGSGSTRPQTFQVDPRVRKPQAEHTRTGTGINNGQRLSPVMSARIRENLETSGQLENIPSMSHAGRDVPDSDIQTQLNYAIHALKESGADYTEETVRTLRNHIATGGKLDVETIMAAVIATTNNQVVNKDDTGGELASMSNVGQSEAGPASLRSQPHAVINSGSVPVPGHNPGRVNRMQNTSFPKSEDQQKGLNGSSADTGSASLPRQKSPAKRKPEKRESKEISSSTKRVKKKHDDSSGWDMLFSGGNDTGGSKASKVVANNGSPDSGSKTIGAGKKTDAEKRENDNAVTEGSVSKGVANAKEEDRQKAVSGHKTHPSRLAGTDHEFREDPAKPNRGRNRSPKRQRHRDDQRDDHRSTGSGGHRQPYYPRQGSEGHYNGSNDGQGMMYPPGNQNFTSDGYPQHMNGEYGMMPNMPMQPHGFQPPMPYAQGPQAMHPQGLTGPAAMQQQMLMHQVAFQQAQAMQQQGMHPVMPHPGTMQHAVGMHGPGAMHQAIGMHPGTMQPNSFLPIGIMPPQVVPLAYPANMGMHPGAEYVPDMQQFGNPQGRHNSSRGRGQGPGRGRRGRGGRGRAQRGHRKRPA